MAFQWNDAFDDDDDDDDEVEVSAKLGRWNAIFGMIKQQWSRMARFCDQLVDPWNRMLYLLDKLSYRIDVKFLDGVGSFHRDDVLRSKSLLMSCLAPSGRYHFELHGRYNFSNKCYLLVTDLLLLKKYSVAVQETFSFVEYFYAINDSVLIFFDVESNWNTNLGEAKFSLRQHIMMVDHVKRIAISTGYRSFRLLDIDAEFGLGDASNFCIGEKHCVIRITEAEEEILLFAKNPIDAAELPSFLPQNIAPLLVNLAAFVNEKYPDSALKLDDMFFTLDDQYLCCFLQSNRLIMENERISSRIACISLSNGQFSIRETLPCLNTGFPYSNESVSRDLLDTRSHQYVIRSMKIGAELRLQWNPKNIIRLILVARFSSLVSLSLAFKSLCRNSDILSTLFFRIPVFFLLNVFRKRLHYVAEEFLFLKNGFIARGILDVDSLRWLGFPSTKYKHTTFISASSSKMFQWNNGMLRVKPAPVGKCCSLQDLAVMAIQRFPNEELKLSGLKLIRKFNE